MARIGQQAPTFATKDEKGNEFSLEDCKGQIVVLFFYPKDDTPGCTRQACAYKELVEQTKNVIVVGISPDDSESHQSFSSKFSLNFPLLLDQDHSISRLYGVWKERTINGEQKLAIERSHFVIDGDGRIIGAERNVSPDESAKKALKVVANANL